MRKDMGAIWGRKGIRALLVVLPVVLVVFIPLAYFVTISLLPVAENAAFPKTILSLLSSESAGHGYRQFWMEAFTTLLCPMLFLAVPIICAAASASCAFVGEKENQTLETILLSSMDRKSIFNAKITACVLISLVISLISFVAFSITVSVADLMLSAPFFFNLDWLILVFLLTPALTLFSVTFVAMILVWVRNMLEALQTVGYLLLPFILLYLVQFTGVFRVGPLLLVILAVLLAVLSIVMFNFSARRFQAERLLTRPKEAPHEN